MLLGSFHAHHSKPFMRFAHGWGQMVASEVESDRM
jgi:hypothetical protein